MLHVAFGWILQAPSPEPVLREELKETDVAPGLIGFLVTFAVVALVIVLMVSLSRRVRRINHADHANHTVSATFLPDGALAAGAPAAANATANTSPATPEPGAAASTDTSGGSAS